MALEDAICLAGAADQCDGDFARAFQRYQDIRIVRTARVQISSMMMSRLNHAKGSSERCAIRCSRAARRSSSTIGWRGSTPRRRM